MSNKIEPLEGKDSAEEGDVELGDRGNEQFGRASHHMTTTSDRLVQGIANANVAVKLEGWKKAFYQDWDPFKDEQYVRNAAKFSEANISFGLLFYCALILFWAYITYDYVTAKPSTTYNIKPSQDMDPVTINLSLKCTSNWGCYNWTDTSTDPPLMEDSWEPIRLVGTYDYVNTKHCPYTNFEEEVRSPFAASNLTFTVCYSSSFNDGVSLWVPFAGEYGSGVVLQLTLTGPQYENEMRFEFEVEPQQKKIIFLSQFQKVYQRSSGKSNTDFEPYVADQFYDGHFLSNVAKLTFKLQQFGYESETIPPSPWLILLSDVGGMSSFLLPVLALLKGMAEARRWLTSDSKKNTQYVDD
mmetsp:Transcript_6628/g.11113  ORF Transcript_6628/g.11113 Transcript_6628/m.11113 type:complete len:355 (+) Transcript_6628:102-1166(+)|eukprot:CAMPEP_0174985662 /NCGR_PEP_ID=MMETSP0004_2-20121128/18469_1 /TAXON_ID=420556 /ORGANISM="Ochromonas sp., Strain CCMP1393" /LENGTH=354 /DNA_ID=CAMNT_0016238341 /DNA_START=67 /DNA_END=1131 /DNA_ORIENTATION=+